MTHLARAELLRVITTPNKRRCFAAASAAASAYGLLIFDCCPLNEVCRLQARSVATAAAAVAGFNDNEIDLAFARYRASADGKRSNQLVFYSCQRI